MNKELSEKFDQIFGNGYWAKRFKNQIIEFVEFANGIVGSKEMEEIVLAPVPKYPKSKVLYYRISGEKKNIKSVSVYIKNHGTKNQKFEILYWDVGWSGTPEHYLFNRKPTIQEQEYFKNDPRHDFSDEVVALPTPKYKVHDVLTIKATKRSHTVKCIDIIINNYGSKEQKTEVMYLDEEENKCRIGIPEDLLTRTTQQ